MELFSSSERIWPMNPHGVLKAEVTVAPSVSEEFHGQFGVAGRDEEVDVAVTNGETVMVAFGVNWCKKLEIEPSR